MKLQTAIRITAFIILLTLVTQRSMAQGASSSNPGEWAAIITGEQMLHTQYKQQTNDITTTTLALAEVDAAQTQVKKWQQQYNSYLKTTQGFASSIAATCTLYHQGIETLTALWEIYNAQKIHAQGTLASLGMTSIYLEIATEYVKTYRQLQQCVSKGGDTNMLNGAERTRLIWDLSDDLSRLNTKLRRLASCILSFSFEDVWNKAIAGKIDKTTGQLAKEASRRAQRAAANVSKMYKTKSYTW